MESIQKCVDMCVSASECVSEWVGVGKWQDETGTGVCQISEDRIMTLQQPCVNDCLPNIRRIFVTKELL